MVIYVTGVPMAIAVAGIFADRPAKDFTATMDGLLFTSPLKEWQFLAGRLASLRSTGSHFPPWSRPCGRFGVAY